MSGSSRFSALPVVAALGLLLAGAGLPAPAQGAQGASRAAVAGVVVDGEGAPVSDAEVRAVHEPSGVGASAVTDGEGRFRISNLRPGGPYTLAARRLGFAESRVRELHLSSGEVRRVEVRVGETPIQVEGIEVEVRPRIRISPSRIGTDYTVGEEGIREFPTLDRDLLELAELSPLVHREEGGRVSVAGGNDRLNAFQLDGLLLQDVAGFPRGDLPEIRRKPLPLEAIQEYRIAASPFDVRGSGFQGGLLQAVTRAGTNEWQATAFSLGRHESLLGGLEVDGFPADAGRFRKLLGGFALGGPLRRDRTHLFVAAEVEEQRRPPSGFHVGEADPFRLQLVPDSVERLAGDVAQRGGEPGAVGSYTLGNPIVNLFARVDHQIGEAHTLTLRQLYAGAEEDLPVNRDAVEAYELSSAGTRWRHSTFLHGAELTSRFSAGWGTSVRLQHQRVRDRARPASDLPRVEVVVVSEVEGGMLVRPVRLGANASAHDLELGQDLVEAGGEISRTIGSHHVSAGLDVRRFSVRHLHMPGSRGSYFFWSPADLAANAPYRYEILLPAPGVEDPAERFRVRELGAFLQSEWNAAEALTVRLGLRAEGTRYPRRPDRNPGLEDAFGVENTGMPGGIALSPRLGVNWHGVLLGRSTQLRGGVGVFQGRIPFEWVGAAYAYTGTRRVLRWCATTSPGPGAGVPRLEPGEPPPTDCVPGAPGGSEDPPDVQLFEDGVRPPRDLKVTAGVDRELPLGLYLSGGVLFSHALRQLHLEHLNLPEPTVRAGDPDRTPDGLGDRTRYSESPFVPGREEPAFGHVIRVGNRSGDQAFSLHVEIGGRLGERSRFEAGYAFQRAVTRQSLTSAGGISAFGRNPVAGDLDRDVWRPSPFQRPHTVTFSAWTSVDDPWGRTEVGLRYRGRSGRPYSYVYMGDPNGDGFPGTGLAREIHNDLIHLPHTGSAAELPGADFVSRAFLQQLIARAPCLDEARGRILDRGACRGPWVNRVDLKAVRSVAVGDRTVELSADLINVLNLLSSDWGRARDVRAAVPLLRIDPSDGIVPGGPLGTDHFLSYAGPRDREEGALLPYTVQAEDSRWQGQLGVRVRF